jgi:hypothetical protein
MASTQPGEAFVSLAREGFGDLSGHEEQVLLGAATGEETDLGSPESSERPAIRASLLRWLCTDPQAASQVAPKGLYLRRAAIVGALDLNGARLEFRIAFRTCSLDAIWLNDARVRSVLLDDSTCEEIRAERAEISGSVLGRSISETDRCVIRQGVSLLRTTITGDVDLSGAHVGCSPAGVAVDLQRARVGGSVFLRRQLTLGAEDPPRPNFTAAGGLSLRYARIEGALDCGGAIIARSPAAAREPPPSLDAEKLTAGAILLNRSFSAERGVRLSNAVIDGPVVCLGSRFGGRGFLAYGMRVDGSLVWAHPRVAGEAEVSLAYATLQSLEYSPDGWPAAGRLWLTGLTYENLHRRLDERDLARGMRHADVSDFLDVIRLQTREAREAAHSRYSPQPYEQLATVLRKQGQDRAARDVLIARTDDHVARRAWPVRGAMRILRETVGYGYRPLRVLWAALIVVAVGSLIFRLGRGSFQPVGQHHPPFSPVAFSLDALLPIIDLGQERAWVVDTPEAGWLAIYYWCHVCIGWLLSSFIVLGITRSAR